MTKITQAALKGNISPAEIDADIADNIRKMEARKRPPAPAPDHPDNFPIDTLPLKLQELITGAEPALGIPPDFLAAAVIAAAGIAAGATYCLELKPGTTQRPVVYLVLVGLPNSNKSGALSLALKPLMDADAEAYKAYRAAKAEFDAIASLSKQDRQAQGVTEIPDAPAFKKCLVNDATPEALTSLHMCNLRGIAAHRDELSGWIADFNKYRAGSDEQFWLSNWSGLPIAVDRKSSDPIYISNPAISVVGTIQPGVLEGLAKGERAANGFIDRLLFCWPEGLEKPRWTAEDMGLYLLGDYAAAIGRIAALGFDPDGKPNALKLAPDARAMLFDFFNRENKPLCDAAPNEALQGIYGKFDLHAARLAIALHLLAWAYGDEAAPPLEVQADTVLNAILAARYFRGQALKAYKRLHEADPVDRLPRDKRELYDALPEEFPTAGGVEIAGGMGMAQRTFKRLLGRKDLFEKVARGQYRKLL